MGGIIIQNLTKTYDKLVALNGVSLEVRAGEVIGLLGPNGAGKSTLMKIVVGILRPTSGSVSVSGYDIIKEPEKAKKVVGYLPENPSLYTGLTVSEFLRFVGKIRAVEDGPLEQRIAESLKTFSLEEKTDVLLGSLSKGMKQKVALIASAIHDPQVLVMDEPLTALDPKTQIFVNNWIPLAGEERQDGAPLHAQPRDRPGLCDPDRHNRQGLDNRRRGPPDAEEDGGCGQGRQARRGLPEAHRGIRLTGRGIPR